MLTETDVIQIWQKEVVEKQQRGQKGGPAVHFIGSRKSESTSGSSFFSLSNGVVFKRNQGGKTEIKYLLCYASRGEREKGFLDR